MSNPNNRVSTGRNFNHEPTCGSCSQLERNKKHPSWGGWCQHPANRVEPSPGWPKGFAPSVATDGGCDLHSSVVRAAPAST